MRGEEVDAVFEQMVRAIEQSHRLQLEVLQMWRTLMRFDQPAPEPRPDPEPSAPRDIDPSQKVTFTVPEVAELLGVSRAAAYRAVKAGDLPALRLGRRWLIPRWKLIDMLQGSSEQ